MKSRTFIKTDNKIAEALIELVLKEEGNSIPNISVTDICDSIDINRSTFYAHFQDVNAVYDYIESTAVNYFLAMRKESFSEPKTFFIRFFELIQKNERGALAYYRSRKFFNFGPLLKTISTKIPERDVDYVVATLSAGLNALIRNWLCKKDRTPAELADLALSFNRGFEYIF